MFLTLLQTVTVPEIHSDSNVAMLIGLAFAIVKGTEKFGEWFMKRRGEKTGKVSTVKLSEQTEEKLTRMCEGIEASVSISRHSQERLEEVHEILDRRDSTGTNLVYRRGGN